MIVTPSIGVGTNALMMVTMIMLKCVVIIDQFEKKNIGTNVLMMVTMIMLKCVVIIDQFEKKK